MKKKKFTVTTQYVTTTTYEVTAKNKDEAMEMVLEGGYKTTDIIDVDSGPSEVIDCNEV